MEYRAQTTEKLIEVYKDECNRINKKDAITTQNLIKQELERRFSVTLKLLDEVEIPTHEVYRYLLQGK